MQIDLVKNEHLPPNMMVVSAKLYDVIKETVDEMNQKEEGSDDRHNQNTPGIR